MDALEELVARDQIRQLAYRYALAVDGKDLDGLAALFVEDVDNGRYGPGREGVKTFYDHALRSFHCSMHLVANHVVDFEGDRSRARRRLLPCPAPRAPTRALVRSSIGVLGHVRAGGRRLVLPTSPTEVLVSTGVRPPAARHRTCRLGSGHRRDRCAAFRCPTPSRCSRSSGRVHPGLCRHRADGDRGSHTAQRCASRTGVRAGMVHDCRPSRLRIAVGCRPRRHAAACRIEIRPPPYPSDDRR